jgi:hypothetical protein
MASWLAEGSSISWHWDEHNDLQVCMHETIEIA